MTEVGGPISSEPGEQFAKSLADCTSPQEVELWMEHNTASAAQEVFGLITENKKNKELALTDQLTGLPNRRAWDIESEKMLAIADRQGANSTVMVIDLEGLNKVNNLLGHETGDEYLLMATKSIMSRLRIGDLAARVGGDEMYLFLTDLNGRQARKVKGRIIRSFRKLLSGLPEEHPLKKIDLGLSIGSHQLITDEDIQDGIQKADKNMYGEKRGRKAQREI